MSTGSWYAGGKAADVRGHRAAVAVLSKLLRQGKKGAGRWDGWEEGSEGCPSDEELQLWLAEERRLAEEGDEAAEVRARAADADLMAMLDEEAGRVASVEPGAAKSKAQQKRERQKARKREEQGACETTDHSDPVMLAGVEPEPEPMTAVPEINEGGGGGGAAASKSKVQMKRERQKQKHKEHTSHNETAEGTAVESKQQLEPQEPATSAKEIVEDLLAVERLEKYGSAVVEEGCSFVDDLLEAGDEDIAKLAKDVLMKKPEVKRFLKAVMARKSAGASDGCGGAMGEVQ